MTIRARVSTWWASVVARRVRRAGANAGLPWWPAEYGEPERTLDFRGGPMTGATYLVWPGRGAPAELFVPIASDGLPCGLPYIARPSGVRTSAWYSRVGKRYVWRGIVENR